jgi:uncharacterized membrane protein
MTELRFQPVASWPVVILFAAVLIGLLWVRPRHVHLMFRQWAALIGLRILVVLLTFFAMLRPTFVYTKIEPVKGSLVLLMDGSRSMQVADSLGERSRWDAMKVLVDSSADDLAKLDEKWDLSAYGFGAGPAPRKLEIHDGTIALAAAADGDQSAIGAAISDALDRETGGRVLGMLLLSDGAQRAVPPHDEPPQLAVRRLAAEDVPLYTFTFGKSGGSERADLSLDDLVTNETVFAETPVEVRGRLSVDGYANQTAKVQLLWESADEMEVVDTMQIDTGAEGGSFPVLLRHTPASAGEYKVTLRVEPREGELVTTNNEVSTFITVRAGGINVLYLVGAKRIDGGPGQEQRFVRASLAQSPDIVVDRRLVDYEPPHADLADVVREDKPDVIIIDDVDVDGLQDATWQAISERVRAGAGLMMLGGYHSLGPGGFRDSPLAEVLPINIGPAQRQSFGEAPREDVHLPGPVKMKPAPPLGTRHPIMAIGGAEVWQQLPQLDGANRISRSELKPNSQVLAEADDSERHPLLVAGQSGDGRTLAFAGDSTWRWQMGGFGDAHRRFWRQVVLWLAKKDQQTDGRVWIRLAGRRVMRGARVDFEVGAEDAQGSPIESAQFDVSVQAPDGANETVRAVRGVKPSGSESEARSDSATWVATFLETAKPGDYRIRVTAKAPSPQPSPEGRGSGELGTAEARFLVPDQDLELDRPAAEPSLMAQLAEMTKAAGGAALAPEELPELLKELADKPQELKEEVVAKVTYWDTWPFFLMFVALISSEWYLRKRWGLV